jgi:hypothetical protein
MRQAHRQQRACYLYAFSGPKDVRELELKVDASSLLELLDFLKYSFGGGTDVDRPLELSLDRLEQKDWSQVRAQRHGSPSLYVHVRSWKLRQLRHGGVRFCAAHVMVVHLWQERRWVNRQGAGFLEAVHVRTGMLCHI